MWFLYLLRLHPSSTLFPYTTLFRSCGLRCRYWQRRSTPLGTPSERRGLRPARTRRCRARQVRSFVGRAVWLARSEEHTSELQSHSDLVCRLLLEKKKFLELK